MKATELIAELQAAIVHHGDLDVDVADVVGADPTTRIAYEPDRPGGRVFILYTEDTDDEFHGRSR